MLTMESVPCDGGVSAGACMGACGVFAITVFQRFALFATTWFVYKAFGLSGSSAFVIIILQGTISVAVDMLPLPGGMGISEQFIFKNIFTNIWK